MKNERNGLILFWLSYCSIWYDGSKLRRQQYSFVHQGKRKVCLTICHYCYNRIVLVLLAYSCVPLNRNGMGFCHNGREQRNMYMPTKAYKQADILWQVNAGKSKHPLPTRGNSKMIIIWYLVSWTHWQKVCVDTKSATCNFAVVLVWSLSSAN